MSPYRHQIGSGAERGFNAAFELVATPALFALLGYFIDRWLGTAPWFTLALAVVVSCYVVWKLWYSYNAQMVELEAELIGQRSASRLVSAENQSPSQPDESTGSPDGQGPR